MNACMVAYTFYETDNRVRRYAETLAKRGDQVDAVVLRRQGQSSFEVINGVNVYRIQNRVRDERSPFHYLAKLLMFFVRSAWMLTVLHLKARYDIIHVHSVPDFQVFATVVPRLTGAKVILDIHDIIPEFYASKFKVGEQSLIFRALLVIEKLSAAYSDHVIIANHLWHGKITQRSVAPEKCTAIINYPDTTIFYRRPRKTANIGEFIMCYPGTLNCHQGLDLAIHAVAIARCKAPQLKFLIIGDGPDREKLQTLIEELAVGDQVVMTGSIPMEQVADIMATVDLGVVPKRRKSFGNEAFSTKILEFMAMGVPTIVSRTKIDEYYFSPQLVRFFDSDSVQDLADKIVELILAQDQYSALQMHGLDYIRLNSWEQKKCEYLNIVDLLLQKRQTPTDPKLISTGQRLTVTSHCDDK